MSKHDPFVTITDQLASAHGGISMRLTQYGYPHDPDGDSETRKGHGAYRHLQAGASVGVLHQDGGRAGIDSLDGRTEKTGHEGKKVKHDGALPRWAAPSDDESRIRVFPNLSSSTPCTKRITSSARLQPYP